MDAIVLDAQLEQCVGRTYAAPWPFLTLDAAPEWTVDAGARVVNAVNKALKLTPVRGAKDALLGRLGAQLIAQHASLGARVNVGTGAPRHPLPSASPACLSDLVREKRPDMAGLPEEIGAALGGVRELIEPFNEGGALGCVSAAGTFFGAAILPEELVSSAEVYRRVYERLDVVCVGGLEVDERGNVNVARRADLMGYVGVGGFVDLTCAADICVFAVGFATGAKLEVHKGGQVSVAQRGKWKFLKEVKEVHFSGPAALQAGTAWPKRPPGQGHTGASSPPRFPQRMAPGLPTALHAQEEPSTLLPERGAPISCFF